jgi:L-ascorbate metabolism protein UlaG (beta-lactamase superfamily)
MIKLLGAKRGLILRGVALIAALFALFLGYAIADGWRAFGHSASGERQQRVERSPRWHDGKMENPQPMTQDVWGSIANMFSASHTSPDAPPPVQRLTAKDFAAPPETGLRVTWLGHSTALIELDGHNVLIDPVWGERASPLTWLGPRRWVEVPVALDALPPVDVVLISHDHYDHLDYPTIQAIKGWDATFVVPLGVGAHLSYWGVPAERIVELDWWEEAMVGDLKVVSTPARHFSGRMLVDTNSKAWTGFALLGRAHRVYYSGDSGMFPEVDAIGERLGPFDMTMIEVGQYDPAWPDVHFGPEQAVDAHRRVRGGVMLPVHWGAFALAYHGWTEPIERVLAAAGEEIPVIVPIPGQQIEPSRPPALKRWWPDIPWKTGAESPIVSSHLHDHSEVKP